MINNHCYNFEKRNYEYGFLDSFIDATYILTMENSERKESYEKQLKEFIPTKTVYIVYNKGFKKCDKVLKEQLSPFDLNDSYLNTMNHSLQNNYNNIIILEDDFIFNPQIKNINVINDINNIFKNNTGSFYFNLGALNYLFNPLSLSNVYSGICILSSHAIIYNKSICIDILKDTKMNNYINWDMYLTLNYKSYFYKYPLAYQKFTNTENKKNWCSGINDFFKNIIMYMFETGISYFELDTQPEIGWHKLTNNLFIINYIFCIIILFVFIAILWCIISKFSSNKISYKNKYKKYTKNIQKI
jgi:hypothetical protein